MANRQEDSVDQPHASAQDAATYIDESDPDEQTHAKTPPSEREVAHSFEDLELDTWGAGKLSDYAHGYKSVDDEF